jgi:hypothetical protein
MYKMQKYWTFPDIIHIFIIFTQENTTYCIAVIYKMHEVQKSDKNW